MLHACAWGSAWAGRVGQGEVGGFTCRVTCTWWLLWLAVEIPWLHKWAWKTLLLPCRGFIVCWWVSVVRVMCLLIVVVSTLGFGVRGLTEMKMIRWRHACGKSSLKWIKFRCYRDLLIKPHMFRWFQYERHRTSLQKILGPRFATPINEVLLGSLSICQFTHIGISNVQVLIFKFKVATTVYQTAA